MLSAILCKRRRGAKGGKEGGRSFAKRKGITPRLEKAAELDSEKNDSRVEPKGGKAPESRSPEKKSPDNHAFR